MLINLAQDYVAASNAHDLTRVEALFADDAIYRSSGVGQHIGVSTIIDMMRTFFEANSDVHWGASNFRHLDNRGVEFDFTITLGGKSSSGVERLYFTADNTIRLIEVER